MLEGSRAVRDLAHASSLCGACADACPVRIDIPRMLIALRRAVDEQKIAPWVERVAFKLLARLLTRPALYRLPAPASRRLQRPFPSDGTISRLPFFLNDL